MKYRFPVLTALASSTLLLAMGYSTQSAGQAPQIEMRERPTDEADYPEYIQYLVDVSFPRTEEERDLDAEIQARYSDAHNIDSIVIAAPGFPADITLEQYEEYMDHFIENGFTSMSVTVSNGSDQSVEEVFERIEFFNDYMPARPERYRQIESLEDFDAAKDQESVGVFYNFQSMNAFGEDLGNVERYYDLGLRTANFTYNVDNAYGRRCRIERRWIKRRRDGVG